MKKVVILGIICLVLCSCGSNSSIKDEKSSGMITCNETRDLIKNGEAVLIDVRTYDEFKVNHLAGAINLDYETIDKTVEEKVSDKDTKIIVYCRSGRRSAIAKSTLESLGYTNVFDLGGISNCDN